MSLPIAAVGTATGPGWQYRLEKDNTFTPWFNWADDLVFTLAPDGNALQTGVIYWLYGRNAYMPAFLSGSIEKPVAVPIQLTASGGVIAGQTVVAAQTTSSELNTGDYSFSPSGSATGSGWQYRLERAGVFTTWQPWVANFAFTKDPDGQNLRPQTLYWLYAKNLFLDPDEDGGANAELVASIEITASGEVVSGSPLGNVLPEGGLSDLLIQILSGISYYAGSKNTLLLADGTAFDYSPSSTEEIDGVYVLAAPGKSGGRWLRRYGLHLSVQDYGAIPDANFATGGGTDNTTAIQKCINFCDRHNLIVWFPGIGGYRTTGELLLKRNIFGIVMSNSSPIMPTGSSFTALRSETEINLNTCKIKIVGPSVVQNGLTQRVEMHGLQLNNPQRSNGEWIEVFNISGKGVDIVNPWDSNFFTITVENCGNLFNYAYNFRGEGDTANMSKVHRLQVERSHDRAIYIQGDNLCVTHDNIHSEQTMCTVNVIAQSNPYAYYFGGGSCDYHNIRLNATTDATYGYNPLNCIVLFRGAYLSVYDARIESALAVNVDANGNGPIDIHNSSLSGPLQSLGTGPMRVHNSKVAKAYGVTILVEYDNACVIDELEVGFTQTLSSQLKVRDSKIGYLHSGSVHSRVEFTGCEIASGSLIGSGYTRMTDTRFTGNLAVEYTQLELFHSEIIGNVTTDTGYLGLYNNSRIKGNLSIGTNRQVIIDQASVVTGDLTNMSFPESALFYPGGWQEGMITRNPRTLDIWQFYMGAWLQLNAFIGPLIKAGRPYASEIPERTARFVHNTLEDTVKLYLKLNGTKYTVALAPETDDDPGAGTESDLNAVTAGQHYVLASTATATGVYRIADDGHNLTVNEGGSLSLHVEEQYSDGTWQTTSRSRSWLIISSISGASISNVGLLSIPTNSISTNTDVTAQATFADFSVVSVTVHVINL